MNITEIELLLERCSKVGIKTLADLKDFCRKYEIKADNTKLLICLLLENESDYRRIKE